MRLAANEIRERTTLKGEVYLGTDFVTLSNCETCNCEFTPRKKNQRFCSKECRRTAKKQPPLESRRCEFCGNEFVPANSKHTTCSGRCRTAKCRRPTQVVRQLDQPRRDAWQADRNKYKAVEFDGRYAGPDNPAAGPLATYGRDLKPTASDVLNAVISDLIEEAQ